MQTASSRRQFAKVAAASVAAPFILPSRVWSADTAPSERLTLGFIGVGKMNSGHLNSFLGRKEVQVVAVCDVDTNRRENAKKTVEERYGKDKDTGFKGCEAYADFRKLLERKDIDAVVIATPDHWHAFIAIAALNAGKDVYCEKPLTHNIHEAITLIDSVRSNKRILQTGSQQRSSKEFRVAAELVRNGIIGKIDHVETQFGTPAKPNANPEEPMEPGLDWDMWCGPGPLVPYSSVLSPRGVHNHFPAWRNTREFGGGMITDWGAHHIDIAQWGLGEDEHGPVEIIAPANYADANDGAKLIYASGIPLLHNGKGRGVSFYGANGEVHVNRGKFELVLGGKTIHKFWDKETDKGTSLDREVILTEREYLTDAKVKLYNSKNHHEDWLNSIKTREKPICDVAIGASTAISCHLMSQAYYHGGSMKWNPEKHEYISGGDAKWLTREYRADWKV
ncbi:Gfo/Idh/MocA family oxidoreductase [Prosthecobacter sp.]|uniref:Gfo/Idh/MocA family oxidoreductase n=1 Tax=Prosthecobacter sp. TaxID=1965333 RepID=UPI00248A5BE3|nr:Gfo/Idh/MocA family oxidoreductase [Prosthecobacter sp.]MDI1311129.1 Gfo/Idh/MocA family oxidoreductase [Prosthecobacter sp.]